MTRILFAKTKWGYPILAIGGNTDVVKQDIDMAGSTLDDLDYIDIKSLESEPTGIYLWEGEYLWGDKWGYDIKTRSIRSAKTSDFVELGLRSVLG